MTSASDRPTLIIDAGLRGLDTRDWRPAFRQTVDILRTIEPEWGKENRMGRYTYVALVGSAGPIPIAEQGIWSGLAKTLPREFPAATARVVRISSDLPGPGSLLIQALSETDAIEVSHDGTAVTTPLAMTHPDTGNLRPLSPTDVVLLTGGARGIGFELAEQLGRKGCRVVVSGRERLRDHLNEGWATATDADFRELRDAAMRNADRASIASVRGEFERKVRLREVMANLRRAAQAGLAIDYVQCNVQDPVSVDALIQAAGDGLRVVVHNAGIDAPRRLRQKPTETMEDVISVKLDGFRNVRAAIEGTRVDVLALTGSLTGRYGGMRGQLDYSAANESLAFAANAESSSNLRVVCTSWPTWDGVGLISNMKAAAQYMEPISVEDGVGAWISEIEGSSRGEVAFMGDFAAVSAQHLVGVPIPSNWSGARKMLDRRQFLGRVEVYEPDALIVSWHTVPVDTRSWFASASVDGRPALPVSAVLEYLVRASDGFILDLGEPWTLENAQVNLAAIGASSEMEIRRTARLIDQRSLVVDLVRIVLGEEVELAQATVRYGPRSGSHVVDPLIITERALDETSSSAYQWPGGHALDFYTATGSEPRDALRQTASTISAREIERLLPSFYENQAFPQLLSFRSIRLRQSPADWIAAHEGGGNSD
ncbi:KR domain-containing protein [Microbacterium oxydans]|uniref:KR domain-containing protein n=1 Tax=Microbacterium oxydans TaxID=82380 RepID=UPI001E49F12D|nr:KR domain-containing protein [Microbacterium oxydans]